MCWRDGGGVVWCWSSSLFLGCHVAAACAAEGRRGSRAAVAEMWFASWTLRARGQVAAAWLFLAAGLGIAVSCSPMVGPGRFEKEYWSFRSRHARALGGGSCWCASALRGRLMTSSTGAFCHGELGLGDVVAKASLVAGRAGAER